MILIEYYTYIYIELVLSICILQRCMPDNDVYLNHLLGRYGNDNLRFWVTSYFRRTSLILLYADNLLYTMHARNCNLIYFYIKLKCLIYDTQTYTHNFIAKYCKIISKFRLSKFFVVFDYSLSIIS